MNKAYFKKLLFMLILCITAALLTSGLRCSSHILHNLNIDIDDNAFTNMDISCSYDELVNAADAINADKGQLMTICTCLYDGKISYDNLKKIYNAVGREHLVLDLSCRKKDGKYYIVTDRWQKFTDEIVNEKMLDNLLEYCTEFLIHAVDVEGKANGIEDELVSILGNWGKIPITYAGGVSSFDDLIKIRELGKNKLNVTIGSALDIFGGSMDYNKVIEFCEGESK